MRPVHVAADCPSELLAALIKQHNATARFLEALRNQRVGQGEASNLPPAPAEIFPTRRS